MEYVLIIPHQDSPFHSPHSLQKTQRHVFGGGKIPKQKQVQIIIDTKFVELTTKFLTTFFGKNLNQTRKLYFDELSITTEGAQKLHDYLLTPQYNISRQPHHIQNQVFWILHTNETVGDQLASSIAWYIEQNKDCEIEKQRILPVFLEKVIPCQRKVYIIQFLGDVSEHTEISDIDIRYLYTVIYPFLAYKKEISFIDIYHTFTFFQSKLK